MQNLRILQAYGQIDVYREIYEPLDQDFLITSILESSHFKKHPAAATFERSFWKWVIQTIEATGEEVDERIYIRYTALLPPSAKPGLLDASQVPPSSYTTYFIETPPESRSVLEGVAPFPFPVEWPGLLSVTMLESRKTFEQGTTGLRTWRPGLIFADWLLRNPTAAKGRVLELGCGAGLTAIICAHIHRAYSLQGEVGLSLCMTDVDEAVLSTCKRNVNLEVNRLPDDAKANWTILDWTDALPDADGRERFLKILSEIDPTVVFGTDLVYDLTIIPALAHTLATLAYYLSKPPEIVLTINMRREATIATFIGAIGKLGLRVEMYDLPRLEDTVFASRRNDVDKSAVIKLIRVFRHQNCEI